MKKKLISILLALVMAISLMPTVAFAGEKEVDEFVDAYFTHDRSQFINGVKFDFEGRLAMQNAWLELSLGDRQAAVDKYTDLYYYLWECDADQSGITEPQGGRQQGGGQQGGDVPIGDVAFSASVTNFVNKYIATDIDQVVGVKYGNEVIPVSMVPFWVAQSAENETYISDVLNAWYFSIGGDNKRNAANTYMDNHGFFGFSDLMKGIRYHFVWKNDDMVQSYLAESDCDCRAMWNMLASQCDLNKDNVLSAEERKVVTKITLGGDDAAKNMTDLMYLWYFPNLEELDVSGCTQLGYINLNWCGKLKTLNITGCTSLYSVWLGGHDIVNSGNINSLTVVGDTDCCQWWSGAGDEQVGSTISEKDYKTVAGTDNFRYWIPQSLLDSGIVTVDYQQINEENAAFTVTLHKKENAAQIWDELYKDGWLANGTFPFRIAYVKPDAVVCGGAKIENGPPAGNPEMASVARWFVDNPMMGSVAITAQGVSVSAGEKNSDRYHGAWKDAEGQETYRQVSLRLALDGMTGYQVKFEDANLSGITTDQIDLSPLNQASMTNFTVVFNEADSCMSCMPKAGSDVSQISFPAKASLFKIKAPKDGYLACTWEYTDSTGHKDGATMAENAKKPVMGIIPSVVNDRKYNEMPYQRDYTVKWSKDGAEDIVQVFTLRFLGQSVVPDGCHWVAIGKDSGDWNMEALRSSLANSGIKVDCNGESGYYHVSFGDKLPSVEDLTAKLRIKAPDGAAYYTMVGRSGEQGVGTLAVDTISTELGQNYQNGAKQNVPANGYLEFPLVQYETMTVEGRTIYYPGAQEEWVQILRWYSASGEELSTEYIGGQCDAFAFETTTPCYVDGVDTYVNENKFKSAQTVNGQAKAVDKPVMIGGNGEVGGCSLSCEMFPQEDGNSYYFRLQIKGGNGNQGKKIVYLPYSFMGADMTYEKAKTLSASEIHHFNDAHQKTEALTGEYTPYGIRFEVNSFSPFTLNWEETSPAPIHRGGGTVVTTVVAENMPLVKTGSRSEGVKTLQTMLNALGYNCGSADGIFGSKTQAAVMAFQKANGLAVDGIVGPNTWAKLSGTGAVTVTTAPAAATSAVNLTISSNMPLIVCGSRSEAVKVLQTKLNALGYDCGTVDGIFGPKTLAAVKAYQTAKNLTVDGMVGTQTWGALR